MANGIKWSSIVKKAHEDPEFKQLLLSDPRGAIESFTGTKLPEGVQYIVHEQTPTTVHLVLPESAEEPAKKDAFFVQDDDDATAATKSDAFFVQDDDDAESDDTTDTPDTK
ncbi:NHLP leader peptide family RiPP precursor [Aggregatilinea lenta]|uniref:NHLP leader peptide family RiPP precursor n=1 Tax=Aggregatilinea lenta TaxID=913108 RepID=UPI000E5B1F24|nr:NHLP leader peptide family RiPP precursor [Aggregatilinea lenta]